MSRHRHRFGASVHLEWLVGGELLRCPCGVAWIRWLP